MTPQRKAKKKDKRKKRIFSAEKITNQKAFKWVGGIKMPQLKAPINTADYSRFTKSYWKQGAVILAICR